MFPIYVFNRTDSGMNAVVGGPLYRGRLFPSLQGHLLYGDYVTGYVRFVPISILGIKFRSVVEKNPHDVDVGVYVLGST